MIPTKQEQLNDKQFNQATILAKIFLFGKYLARMVFEVVTIPLAVIMFLSSRVDQIFFYLLIILYIPYFVYQLTKASKYYHEGVMKIDERTSNRKTFSSINNTKL